MDLEITGKDGRLAWKFTVTDPTRFSAENQQIIKQGIRIKLAGHKNLEVKKGKAVIETEVGPFLLQNISINGEALSPVPAAGGTLELPVKDHLSASQNTADVSFSGGRSRARETTSISSGGSLIQVNRSCLTERPAV
jgi:hypothetical protein